MLCFGTCLAVGSRVPSQQHEILVELFRNRPELAYELLHDVAGLSLAAGTAELASNDLSQAIAVEYRADAVTVIRDKNGEPTSAVIVEVQLHVDRGKRLTWPLYIAALRARLECAVVLLVLTPDDAVARWARTAIEMGHPGFELRPIVVGFAELPRVTDRERIRQTPELGVLSVMAHRDLAIALVVAPEILEQPEVTRQVYLDLIYRALPDAAGRALKELLMQKYEYQSDIVREYVAQGREEGREEGREQGREEGRAEGIRFAIGELVRAKLGSLPAPYERALLALDVPELTSLVAEVGGAGDVAELETVFARLLARTDV